MIGNESNAGVTVTVNGVSSPIRTDGLASVADMVELIKGTIDPEHMITSLLVNGRELQDHEWSAAPKQFGTAVIEVLTGSPREFVSERLAQSAEVVRSTFIEFRDARKLFQAAQTADGNKKLITAVNTLKAFFEWYGTMMELVPVNDRPRYEIMKNVEEISATCKKICQQQLYQSWWALGETIANELEPQLDKLEDVCRKF
jgi:hypothetical protein